MGNPPPKEAEQPEEVDIPVRADTGSPALTKMQLREQVYLEASINYETKWSQQFSWLVFGKTKDGFPYVKCSICMSYAKGSTRYAMQGDDDGRDLQTQSFRAHEHTDAHKAAVDRQLKLAAGISEGQQAISDFINSDVEGRRAIRLMRSTQFLCQCDDAAESNEDLGMVNKVVRTVATLLGNSSVWSQRFKLCKVLGACIVLLWEHNHKAYEIVTCYKFQFCLFFLADILADMNDLNRCFQRREISKTIESTTDDLTERYLTTNKPFGGEGKSWLVKFLKVHKEGGGKQVRVRGVDGEGRPINHLYTMHERKLKGHKQGSTYADCVKLCRQFARDCVDNMNERLDDLVKLGPTKLFRAGKRWPNLILLWQALAVLPLSTVECERGFSRQNIIKSWVRGALCNAHLGELMQITLLKYEIEWPEALEVWRSMRRRRPVKSLKVAVAERERKGKQKEGEAVAAGTAGENEDEGEEEEEDDEVEQDLGDDQEVVEEEDNPFLSDDEDVEEVYFIDKPVHYIV
ncbi:unnamed protein product [Closterium sp. NIES-53]